MPLEIIKLFQPPFSSEFLSPFHLIIWNIDTEICVPFTIEYLKKKKHINFCNIKKKLKYHSLLWLSCDLKLEFETNYWKYRLKILHEMTTLSRKSSQMYNTIFRFSEVKIIKLNKLSLWTLEAVSFGFSLLKISGPIYIRRRRRNRYRSMDLFQRKFRRHRDINFSIKQYRISTQVVNCWWINLWKLLNRKKTMQINST
jgi:hypothetical protein